MNSLLAAISILFLLIALLHGQTHGVSGSFDFSKERTLVLVAHPDDECMFFAPTIVSLTAQLYGKQTPSQRSEHHKQELRDLNKLDGPRSRPEVFAFSLSVGNADGLGRIRRQEFAKSTQLLGIPDNNVFIIDNAFLQDDIYSDWDPIAIARAIKPTIERNNITTILTFDRHGISNHPNHRSLPAGVVHFLTDKQLRLSTPTPRLFTLTTVPLLSKYTGFLAPLFTRLGIHLSDALKTDIIPTWLLTPLRNLGIIRLSQLASAEDIEGNNIPASKAEEVTHPLYISDIWAYFTALRAMRTHWSQLVWFRYLYVLFSRYMWVNDWVEVVLSPRDGRIHHN